MSAFQILAPVDNERFLLGQLLGSMLCSTGTVHHVEIGGLLHLRWRQLRCNKLWRWLRHENGIAHDRFLRIVGCVVGLQQDRYHPLTSGVRNLRLQLGIEILTFKSSLCNPHLKSSL